MKTLITLLLVMTAAMTSAAQNVELNRLTETVIALRNGGESAYNQAVATLSGDRLWTPMDELGTDRQAECRVADKVPGFRLNSILTNAENKQRYQTTTGNHLNGADSRYNYSLFEKTIKAGATATYTLNERWGDQTFIIIPFDGSISSLKATVSCGDKQFTATPIGNEMMKITGKAKKGTPLTFKITNRGATNASYVVINYNARN